MSISQTISLHIDTSQNTKVTIGIEEGGKVAWFSEAVGVEKAQRVLPLVASVLDKKGLSWDSIAQVIVIPGPGSFTGLRVGFAVGNTLTYLLGLGVGNQTPRY